MSINEKLEQLKQEAREAAAAGDLNAQWKYANYMMSFEVKIFDLKTHHN